MNSDRRLVKLGTAPLEIIDGDRGKNYPKNQDFSPKGYCLFLNTSNVTPDGFSLTNCNFISQQKDEALKKGKLQRHDIVLTTRGTVGNVAFYDETVPYEHVRINSGMVVFRPNLAKLVPDYLYYYLKSPLFREQMLAYVSGSAQPQLPIRDIQQLEIFIPELKEQHAITQILKTLDDKIELNRRMNHTLEEMARAIFKSWFVDFDPVVAKAEGRQPYGMNAETAALFPAEFVDTELDAIPIGWRVEKLGDVCEFSYGKSLTAQNRRSGTIAVFGSDGQIGWHDTALAKGPGIIIGRKGNAGKVNWAFGDFFPIDTTFFVIPNFSYIPLIYLFFAIRSLELENFSGDSAVPGLNREMAYLLKLLLPPEPILQSFAKLASSLFRKIDLNQDETRVLSNLRDALLPKLLSGEIRVKQAEKLVEQKI